MNGKNVLDERTKDKRMYVVQTHLLKNWAKLLSEQVPGTGVKAQKPKGLQRVDNAASQKSLTDILKLGLFFFSLVEAPAGIQTLFLTAQEQ